MLKIKGHTIKYTDLMVQPNSVSGVILEDIHTVYKYTMQIFCAVG